ncbi:unnamed protein product [Orchesella dallaii]|uniref:Apolipoprotein D n=1 Tax=Orchesella dallaii TaxID=48710 RepID=A0ABP1Q547_9HEXA
MSSYDLRSVLSFLVLLSAFGTCFGQANQTCIHTELVTPVYNFSVDSFLGTWYAHTIYSGLAQDATPLGFRCLSVNFSRSDDDIFDLTAEERYFTFPNGTDIPHVVTDDITISEKSQAIWKVMTFTEDGETLEADSVVVQTDYTNWALEFGCSVRDNYRYETMQIWSRVRNPDPEVVAILELLVNNYGFPPANGRLVDHLNC